MKRKVCVVTGSRAEYGLLKWLLRDINASEKMQLQLVVTGAHLSPEFGLTYREIEADGLTITRKVESLLSSDTVIGATKSLGLCVIGFADVFAELGPDLLVVLGDRYELLAPVSAALLARIPIAHIHGGEVTEGAIDDAVRHAITKSAHVHFVSTNAYRNRVIQMGENPDCVHLVGGLGVDAISRISLLDQKDLSSATGIEFGERNLMVTFHPETLSSQSPNAQVEALLQALDSVSEANLIITYPNADVGGHAIATIFEKYVARRSGAHLCKSLGQLNYLSCLQFVDGVVGNSSSGLLEAPSFHIGTVNIGRRQAGRSRASSVIDCEADTQQISDALARLYSPSFRNALADVINPYGDGGASRRIVEYLEQLDFSNLLRKSFFDLDKAMGGTGGNQY